MTSGGVTEAESIRRGRCLRTVVSSTGVGDRDWPLSISISLSEEELLEDAVPGITNEPVLWVRTRLT